MLVEELVQKPFRLLSMISDKQPSCPPLSRHILTTKRCYCILLRLPFFELHFGVLNRCVHPVEIFYTEKPESDFYYCYIDLDFVKFILGVVICLTNN